MSTSSTTESKVVLVPQYLKKFNCLTSECEDTCCAGWSISIDKKTYEKYTQLNDLEGLPMLEEFSTLNPASESNFDYATIKMNSDLACPMLTSDAHCTLHRDLGDEYLSLTCRLYPRMSNFINGMLERSLTVSCPEAARLALLNPEPMEFDEMLEPADYDALIAHIVDTNDPSVAGTPTQFFWDLRIFTIQVLQNREYGVNERLIALGMFYNKAQEYVDAGRTSELPQLINMYSKVIQDGSIKSALVNIPAQTEMQMHLFKMIMSTRIRLGFNQKRYVECLNECLQGLQYADDRPLEELSAQYREAYDQHFHAFFEEYEYVFENYLVNYVFKKGFPLGRSMFDEYIVMVIQYTLIKIQLVGMAGHHQGMNTDLLIKLVQSFAKTTEHFSSFFDEVLNLLKANDLAKLPLLTILIKN